MPSRGPVIDPFALKEGSRRIPTSICIPTAWLNAVRRHADAKRVSISEYLMDALEAHAKTTGLELPEVKR
jgi:hypothetical protein